MSSRLRMVVASCGRHAEIVRGVAPRFNAIAEIDVLDAGPNGAAVESLLPVLATAAPHVAITDPTPVAYLAERTRVTVLPFEVALDSLMTRIDEALQQADSVGVLLPAGTLSPVSARALKRLGATVHVFPSEGASHLPDLVARCRRMGLGAVVGSETAVALAREQGIRAISVNDCPDEADGLISRMILKAAALAAPRVMGRAGELVAYGLILEKICQGGIGPHDTALCVDGTGLVSAVFAHRCHEAPAPGAVLALPAGVSLVEALRGPAARFTGHVAGGEVPLQLDLYPLAEAGGEGYLVVLRGEPRVASRSQPDTCVALPADPQVSPLLERLQAVVERAEVAFPGARRRATPRRFLASLRRRHFLVDWSRVRYFELRSGLVYAALQNGEAYATNYTLTDVLGRVDPRDFFRIHRNVVVNLNYVTEVERFGVSQFRLVLEGPDSPAFVASRPASAALRKLLKY